MKSLITLLILFVLVSDIYCKSSWSQLYSDKYQSNSIEFTKSHEEWITSFPNKDFLDSSKVAFDVNRGKIVIFNNVDDTLSLLEIDILNGEQHELHYPIKSNLISPFPSNLVIDGNNHIYFSLSDNDGHKYMVKADLTSSNILYVKTDKYNENDVLCISDDGNLLIAAHGHNLTVYNTLNLQPIWSRQLGDGYGYVSSLLIGNDYYFSSDKLYKLNVKTGNVISTISIPYSITLMSYSGIPGWIMLGITNIEHRWHQYTSIGIVNVDLSKFTQIVLISDEMARDLPGTSNIISSFQISNSNSNSTTFQINSVLEAHTGNRGNYFGTSSTFTIGKNMSDVSNLEIKKNWNFNFDGGVASIQNDRKSVVLLDENKFILILVYFGG